MFGDIDRRRAAARDCRGGAMRGPCCSRARGQGLGASTHCVIELDLIIDRSSVEAFANDGELTVAGMMLPGSGAYTVALHSRGAIVERMDIWKLRSVW